MSGLEHLLGAVADRDFIRGEGRVQRVVGLAVETQGVTLPIGATCRIRCRMDQGREIEAEVVGFRDGRSLLIPCGKTAGITPGDPVIYDGARLYAKVSTELLGRVLNGAGREVDDLGPISWQQRMPLDAEPIPPLKRQRIEVPLVTGVRAIDGVLTCGRGQRLGIFAGSGVGKSVLLGMLARNSEAAVNVIALIGERGREVREFVERDLGPEGLARSIVIFATSDEPPVMRLRAARLATAIAEWFRDQGQDVLFMLDSVTRVAMAQREVGLSAHEPPTSKAFPPSVYSLLARLLERTGPGEHGTITSFYTVLVEGDDLHDPIGDAVRGILDGHIWLSRSLANRGHFPAVDVLESISRAMSDVTTAEHQQHCRALIRDVARYSEVEDLIQLGAYARGADPKTDGAVDRMPAIQEFLRQAPDECCDWRTSQDGLAEIFADDVNAGSRRNVSGVNS